MKGFRSVQAMCLAWSLVVPAVARASTIDYTAVGDFTGPSFSTGGVTASAENGATLVVGSLALGLGVVGGSADTWIDLGESVVFAFDSGGATGVTFHLRIYESNNPFDQSMVFEGFGLGGGSLGVQTFGAHQAFRGSVDVSGAFGNVVLTAFRIAGHEPSTRGSVGTVTFTDAPQPHLAPEPATLVLLATGLFGAGFARRTRRR